MHKTNHIHPEKHKVTVYNLSVSMISHVTYTASKTSSSIFQIEELENIFGYYTFRVFYAHVNSLEYKSNAENQVIWRAFAQMLCHTSGSAAK